MNKSLIIAARLFAFVAIILSAGALSEIAGQGKSGPKAGGELLPITIITEPGAAVWIDGVSFGRTGKDGTLIVRTSGGVAHVLRVRADGFKEKVQTVPAAKKSEIKVALVKTTDEAELAFQEAGRLSSVDREKAIAAYRRAAKLRPSFPEAYIELARALSENGDHEEARTAVAAARRLRPGFAEASAVEGRLLKEAGNEEKAIAAFKRAITEGKGFQPEALTGLGLLYKERAEGAGGSGDLEQEKADYDQAAKYFKQALKQLSGSPDSLVVYQLLGLIYERQHRFQEAIALYEEFLRLFPDSSDASAVRSFIEQIRIQMSQTR